MRIIVSGRHVNLDDELKEYVSDKAGRLDKYYDRITEIDAVVSLDAGQHEVEMIVRADHHHRFVAKERHADPRAAVDLVIDHLGRQLTRHKDKHRNRKHPE